MIIVTDYSGVDLSQNPPADQTLTAGGAGVSFAIQAKITETDTMLPFQFLSGTVDWRDGSPPTVLSGNGTITVDLQHTYQPGQYVVSVYAHDYASPAPSEAQVNFLVSVEASTLIAQPSRFVYGPILPRDSGFPGPQDWLFNSSSDIFILESSVRMLLSTTKGERIMEPDYGTQIVRILFETNAQSIEPLIQQEIVEAIARWEPRVELQSLVIERDPNNRSVTVTPTFLSKLSQRGFQTTLQFTP